MTHLKRAVLLLFLLLLLLLTACEKKPVATPTAAEPPQQTEPEPPPPPPPPPRLNPLTAMPMAEDYELARPIAVMINNIKPATPPRGLGEFDAAFEVLAEGEVNRIIAVFYDYDGLKELGSVRSARDYYFRLVLPLEPIILHYGGSPQAYTYFKKNKLDNLNGIDGDVDSLLYWRDKARAKSAGYEHSVFTDGAHIVNTIEKKGRKTELKNGDTPYFKFNEQTTVPGDLPGARVVVPFSGYIKAEFAYDAAGAHYLRSQYGAPHVDDNTGAQIAVDNLFVLQATHKAVPNDPDKRIEVGVVGKGEGFYFSQGKGVAIRWSKESDTAFYKLTTPDGAELAVNPGSMWFCIVKPTAAVTHE